jgi:glycosyltransferase involved in cell wall biosynthesis
LTLIGNGTLKAKLEELFQAYNEVEIVDFLQPEQLVEEIVNYGAFILPSRKEAWGVVIHEFCAAGFPILTSSVCGASTMFLKHGFNGYQFKSEDAGDLKNQLINIFNQKESELIKMGKRSHLLAQAITPQSWASTLLSIIN